MKTITTLIVFLALIAGTIQAQSNTQSYTIYCEKISTVEASNAVKDYLLNTYPQKITGYDAHLDTHTAIISSIMEPIDLLQLYRMQGYVALYIASEGRYWLNDGGDQMILTKE